MNEIELLSEIWNLFKERYYKERPDKSEIILFWELKKKLEDYSDYKLSIKEILLFRSVGILE